MKKKTVFAKKSQLIKLKSIMIKKFRRYKLRMADFEMAVKGIDPIISAKVKEYLGLKIKRLVLKATDTVKDEIYKDVMTDIHNGYLDFVSNMAGSQIRHVIEKKVIWKTKTFKLNDCGVFKIREMYEKGWKIAFFGKLSGDEEVMIFEKPSVAELNKKPLKKKKNKGEVKEL